MDLFQNPSCCDYTHRRSINANEINPSITTIRVKREHNHFLNDDKLSKNLTVIALSQEKLVVQLIRRVLKIIILSHARINRDGLKTIF